jgi:hypothetical protein
VPTQILLLRLSLRINDDLHSHFIKVVEFVLVEDFELDSMPLASIGHLKEKPL